MRRTPAFPGTGVPTIREEVLERWRWRYEKQRPKVLYGRSTVLSAFASFLQEFGTRHRPRVVIATGDVLDGANRKLLESAFRTVPFVHYGSRDVGMIGAECAEHEGLHFHPWGSYVEFDPIGESRDGTVYRLLVTDLLNYGQPFIRYDTGDCVTLAQQSCSCGSWFPLVDQVVGRIESGTIRANGKPVTSVTLNDQAIHIEKPYHVIRPMRITRNRAANRQFRDNSEKHSLSA